MEACVWLCLALVAVALLMHRLGVHATRARLRAPAPDASIALPPLTLLKPIKGLEEGLEHNLRSFFEQSYPAPLQFVFASTEPGDPGIAVARRIASEYPEYRARFVLSDPGFGINPKVSNLAGALRAAEYDLVLQTDANVRIRPGYLQAVAREYQQRGAALLGALLAGSGERALGAVLETIQLTTFVTPGICLADFIAGIACVIGKSIMFRRSELERLGGLALVKDVLAEDFVLGQHYARAGKRVLLSNLVVENVNVDAPLSRFLSRHSRWLKMRVVVHAGGFVADLVGNAGFFALLAAVLSGMKPGLLALYFGVVAYKLLTDARLIEQLRGYPMPWAHRLCMPLRDLLMPAVWLYALCSRTTQWRGERFRLSRGSRLTPIGNSLRPVPELNE